METRGLVKIVILLLVCLAVHAFTSQAQTLYSKDSKITIAPRTTLTIGGSVENSGTISNDGYLRVGGPWVNSGSYISGTGAITFNSTSSTIPQIIHHNGQTFNRVTVAGGTKKIMLSDLVVAEEINFEDGVIETSGNSKIIFEADVAIYGASDSSHINGRLFQRGMGRKLFPIGNGLIYLPVELTDVTDETAIIGVQVFEFASLLLTTSSAIDAISDKRYWHIDVASGALQNSQIVLPFRGESWISDPEKVVVVQSPAPADHFTSIGRAFFEQGVVFGRVASDQQVTMPFVTLGTTATERELIVYNAVSPNGDGMNDYLRIENIEDYPNNALRVFNRWGDKVFEIENCDNRERAFRGRANVHGDQELASGTYFYVLDLPDRESLRGFVAVR